METTGIGSLPHHNIDSALEYSFRFSIPFLPQIPVRNPKEFMISQSLEGLPGLILKERGEVSLNKNIWEKKQFAFKEKLDFAFRSKDKMAFKDFEPSSEAYSSWKPFLWELSEKKIQRAKIQIAGPMTAQWSLKLEDGSPADKDPELGAQIFKLVLARSISMIRQLNELGVSPIIYIDEPGFYCFSTRIPKHVMGLQELKILLQTLKKEKATVGLHCCSNTDWNSVLSLDLDILSLDTSLSLNSFLENQSQIKEFLAKKGTLSLGIIPTLRGKDDIEDFNPTKTAHSVVESFLIHGFSPKESQKILLESFYTPACGLALHKVEDAERCWELLEETTKQIKSTIEK